MSDAVDPRADDLKADHGLFVGLVRLAMAAQAKELIQNPEGNLRGLRLYGLRIVQREGKPGYRIDAVIDPAGEVSGWKTREAWESDRDKHLGPWSLQLAGWLARLWREQPSEKREVLL